MWFHIVIMFYLTILFLISIIYIYKKGKISVLQKTGIIWWLMTISNVVICIFTNNLISKIFLLIEEIMLHIIYFLFLKNRQDKHYKIHNAIAVIAFIAAIIIGLIV